MFVWAIGDKKWRLLFVGLALMVLSSILMLFDNGFQVREVPGLYGPALLILTLPVTIILGIHLNRRAAKCESDFEPLTADDIDDEFD